MNMEAILKRAGIHVDELNRLRLMGNEAAETSTSLQSESKEFVTQLESFSKAVDSIMNTFDELATLVEAEKLRAITLRNEVKTMDKQRSATNQQIQVLIRQRQVELERLRIELAAAQKVEAEQREYIQQFIAS